MLNQPRLGDHVLYQMNDGSHRSAVVTNEYAMPSLVVFLIAGRDFLAYRDQPQDRPVLKWDSILMEKFPPDLILDSSAIATVEQASYGFSPGQWHEDTRDNP